MHETRVLEPGALTLLRSLGLQPELKRFFLVGGTALAIQIGHRRSEDLDLFTLDEFDPAQLLASIKTQVGLPVTVVGTAPNTLNLVIADVKVDLIRHGYPLVLEPIRTQSCQLASRSDIAAMKLGAITNRGGKKDFIDLYFLLQEFSLSNMLNFYKTKYEGYDIFPVVRSLFYFDDAESDPDPVMLKPVPWETIKSVITDAAAELG